MKKIAIIGAGISGLFIANLFKKNSDYQVLIYEKSNSINLEEGYGIQLINLKMQKSLIQKRLFFFHLKTSKRYVI